MSSPVESIKLAVVKEVAAAGSVRGAQVLGLPGGYQVIVRVGMKERVLADKAGKPRTFLTIDSAGRLLRSVGIGSQIELNIANYAPRGGLLKKRVRPDRAAALNRAAAHDKWFRAEVEATLKTPDRQTLPAETVHAQLRAHAKRLRDAAA